MVVVSCVVSDSAHAGNPRTVGIPGDESIAWSFKKITLAAADSRRGGFTLPGRPRKNGIMNRKGPT
jgi:hypothetical protein